MTETKYQVVRHDMTTIQYDITTAQPGTFYDPASAQLYAAMLQMTAPDVRVQYIVEAVSDETPA